MALHTVLQRIAALRYSRYPVYEGSIDQVIGILHTKDLLDLIASQPLLLSDHTSPAPLRQILRSPLFVPASVGMDVLLAQMQRTKTQFAVVIDEYGGMAGVATMEDVIEELVGDVQDEFDQETLAIQTTGNTLVIDGLVSLSEIADRFGDPVGEAVEATTIGGYLTERLDRIPQVGDVVQYDRYDLRVEAMEGRRVASVRFILREAVPTVSG
jgi:putative hemolysin